MCVDRYVGFSCGHMNPVLHVPCPLTRANEQYISRCSISARHFVQEDKYCHACHRADWQQNVLAIEEAHRQKHVGQGGICTPDCGYRFFSDTGNFVQTSQPSTPQQQRQLSTPSHQTSGSSSDQASTSTYQHNGYASAQWSTFQHQNQGYATAQTSAPQQQNNSQAPNQHPSQQSSSQPQSQGCPTAQTSTPQLQNNSQAPSQQSSPQQYSHGNNSGAISTPQQKAFQQNHDYVPRQNSGVQRQNSGPYGQTSAPQQQNSTPQNHAQASKQDPIPQQQKSDLRVSAPPCYFLGWPYNQPTLPQQQNYPIFRYNPGQSTTTNPYSIPPPQRYVAPPPNSVFNSQFPYIHPPTHLGPPLTTDQKETNKAEKALSKGKAYPSGLHNPSSGQVRGPPQRISAEWDVKIDHRYGIGHSEMPGPVTGLPWPLELMELRARDEHMAGISTHPYAVDQEIQGRQKRRTRSKGKGKGVATEIFNNPTGAVEVGDAEVETKDPAETTSREYIGYQMGLGSIVYKDCNELKSVPDASGSTTTVLHGGRQQSRSVFPRVHMWGEAEIDTEHKSESAELPPRPKSSYDFVKTIW